MLAIIASNMARWKAGLSAIIGLLIIASFIGYNYEEDFEGIPRPNAGVCGVTKDSFSDVPGDGAIFDISVTLTWDDSAVWIGIIDVETYENLVDIGGDSKGKVVACDSDITFLAGGPSSGDSSSFDWTPTGEEFHIMMGSVESGGNDDDDDDDNPIPWPGPEGITSMSFTGEFTVHVEGDISGGWGIILILLIIEIGAVWYTLLDQ